MYQKTIKLFLQDGDPNERITCELSNWDGIAYKIPRSMLKVSNELKYINNTGDYLLLGDIDGIPNVYVGEAENLYNRLLQHISDDKEFWTECIIFTRKDNSLNKAHVKYIENNLYNEARKSARYEVYNSTVPTLSTLSEFEEAEMKEIIDNIKMLTNALGYKVFISNNDNVNSKKESLFLNIKNVTAEGIYLNEGLKVLKNSKISHTIAENSYNPGYKKLRERLINEGIIDKDNEVFVEDYIFSSPSAAAAVCLGYNVNGLTYWKDKKGTTLKELQNR